MGNLSGPKFRQAESTRCTRTKHTKFLDDSTGYGYPAAWSLVLRTRSVQQTRNVSQTEISFGARLARRIGARWRKKALSDRGLTYVQSVRPHNSRVARPRWEELGELPVRGPQ